VASHLVNQDRIPIVQERKDENNSVFEILKRVDELLIGVCGMKPMDYQILVEKMHSFIALLTLVGALNS
jgi:hypothetical protein